VYLDHLHSTYIPRLVKQFIESVKPNVDGSRRNDRQWGSGMETGIEVQGDAC
jgi:hypothetical protein